MFVGSAKLVSSDMNANHAAVTPLITKYVESSEYVTMEYTELDTACAKILN